MGAFKAARYVYQVVQTAQLVAHAAAPDQHTVERQTSTSQLSTAICAQLSPYEACGVVVLTSINVPTSHSLVMIAMPLSGACVHLIACQPVRVAESGFMQQRMPLTTVS